MADLHPRVRTVVDALAALGASAEVQVLPDSARTAAEAAEALGVGVGAIVNSLIFESGGLPLLILTSGSHRVDTAKVGIDLDLPEPGRATPDFVRLHTGQAIGGVSPVGHPVPLRTLVDRELAAYPKVWAAAGHPQAVFATSYDELVQLTRGTPVDVA